MHASSFPPAYRFQHGRRQDRMIVCDHASNLIPEELGDLGLSEHERRQHIAWDPGAAAVASAMARSLDCPAMFGEFSRLVVDLNRDAGASDLIVGENDGLFVSGNLSADDDERRRRIARYHEPYHNALASHLDTVMADGIRPCVISIHSFAPVYHGRARPWQLGLLWKQRAPWLESLFSLLGEQGLTVGDNQPYNGRVMMGGTLDRHALARGLRHILIELRQDLIASPDDQAAWADRLTTALSACGFLQLESDEC